MRTLSDNAGSRTILSALVGLSRDARQEGGVELLTGADRAPVSGAAGAARSRWKSAAASDHQSRSLLDVQLLLVDDSSDNQLLFTRILTAAGAHVTGASNGREAILAQAGRDYDVIIMDIQMPEVDGYMATTAIRQNGYAGPVIALTAHDIPGEERRCREAGCSHFETKPIDRSNLLRAVFAAISQY